MQRSANFFDTRTPNTPWFSSVMFVEGANIETRLLRFGQTFVRFKASAVGMNE